VLNCIDFQRRLQPRRIIVEAIEDKINGKIMALELALKKQKLKKKTENRPVNIISANLG